MISSQPFDDLAADYDPDGAHAARAAELVGHAAAAFDPTTPARTVLDVGTGTGAAAFAALRRFPDATIIAVDLSASMIRRARQIAATVPGSEQITWVHGDALPFPADDGTADLVLCTSSLHFFPAAVFADWRRVLRTGGVAAYTLPLRSAFHPGPAFADLLPAADDRIPLPDGPADAADGCAAIPGFVPVGVEIGERVASFVIRAA